MKRIGVILNNIGSPQSPSPEDVGIYLKEFLMDKEILTLPFFVRYPLVNWLIVPRRKFSSALKYAKIWGKRKSPLLEISEDFAAGVQSHLGSDFNVQLGMVNGNPSIEGAVRQLKDNGVQQIIFAPLYPQYARATTYASTQKTKAVLQKLFGKNQKINVIPPFYQDEGFIHLSAEKLKHQWQQKSWQHILFSFHGLPESQIKKTPGCLADDRCCSRANACALNCYRAQSLKTAHLIAEKVGLTKDQFTIGFQSRLGPAKWIGPASTDVVHQLAAAGQKRILVQTPSFVADCLETLEEIAIELKAHFLAHGGEDLQLVPCLNQDANWAKIFAGLVRKQANSET